MHESARHIILRRVVWCSIWVIAGALLWHVAPIFLGAPPVPTSPQHTEFPSKGREALPSPKSPPRPVSPADNTGKGQGLADTTQIWTRITIHHTDTASDNPDQRVASIQDYHVRVKGWDDIGYHFLIAEDGRFWHGRPLSKQGAHVLHENEENIGIAFIGSYGKQPPPEAALATCRQLLQNLQRHYCIPNTRVYFHSDLAATGCPGSWDKSILFRSKG